MKRSLETFPVFPHCVEDFLADFDADAHGVPDYVEPDPSPSTVPLGVRSEDFKRSVGTLHDVLELEALGPELYGCYFVVCETVSRSASELGAHLESVSLPCHPLDETTSLIAIAATSPGYARASLDKLSVLLHEIAHLRFPNHDVWFTTMLNWQRLRCGLPCSQDPYDVRDETIEKGFAPGTGPERADAALTLACEMATPFRTVDSMSLVTAAVEQLSYEYRAAKSGYSGRDRAFELAATISLDRT